MKKTDVKLFALMTGAVLAAGFIMVQFNDFGPVNTARQGFNA